MTFGVPFREAHEIVGKVLRAAEQEGKSIREMPMERLKDIFTRVRAQPGYGADLESALARRRIRGGTAPAQSRSRCADFKARIAKLAEHP